MFFKKPSEIEHILKQNEDRDLTNINQEAKYENFIKRIVKIINTEVKD